MNDTGNLYNLISETVQNQIVANRIDAKLRTDFRAESTRFRKVG